MIANKLINISFIKAYSKSKQYNYFMNKVIFLFDLNSFFASAEIARRPELRGKEVLIGSQNNHAIVTALTPGAKAKGVYVGMPYYRASKVVPEGVFVDPDHSYYVGLSNAIFNHIKQKFTSEIEVSSIDEAYIDATNYLLKNPISEYEFAREILDSIKSNFKVTASIGISDSKFLAKMASEFYKWDEVSTCYKHEIKSKLWKLNINQMWGVGSAYADYFEKNGIVTIGDFATIESSNVELSEKFKKDLHSYYYQLMNWTKGISTSDLDYEIVDAKSISKQITLNRYIENEIEMRNFIKDVSTIVSDKLTSTNMAGSRINVLLRFGKFSVIDKSTTLNKKINSVTDIYDSASRIVDQIWNRNKPVKGLRITISNLSNQMTQKIQQNLFDEELLVTDKNKDLINNVNSIIGYKAITSGKDFKKNPKYKRDNAFRSNKIKFKSWD